MSTTMIGDLIRAHRKARQWSLEDLASRSGLKSRVISHYELNRIKNVPSHSIMAIAKAFGIEPGDLYPKQMSLVGKGGE